MKKKLPCILYLLCAAVILTIGIFASIYAFLWVQEEMSEFYASIQGIEQYVIDDSHHLYFFPCFVMAISIFSTTYFIERGLREYRSVI